MAFVTPFFVSLGKTQRVMTIDEIISVLLAFKDGKRIEMKLKGDSVWVERIGSEPTFNFQHYEYRVLKTE